ncbi:acyl-CoA dehydrogenase family protein [Phytohabitans kaempferiae]|uniref:Acyl-CoA dehydrogenase family protein n=1 Tax=Phytohabitans kaempferiae TaxID=1620943 RepID=A0ABV6MG39_9ACTN
MRITLSSEEAQFRDRLREWLAVNVPTAPPPKFYTRERRDYDSAWQRRLWDGGYGALGWPREYGGGPVTVRERMIFQEELARAGAPDVGCLFIALNHAGPTLLARGTEQQKARHIEPILRGDQLWCQGFSEPEAGSDLAAIRTTGEVLADRVVVNGRKIWTSYGHLADYCELLVRTDRRAERHRGLTWLILDMRSSGLDVRPIRTLTGNPRFCEVVLDNVEVPIDNVVGEVHEGWRVAMTTLGFERGSGMLGRQVRTLRRIEELREFARENGAHDDPVLRSRIEACVRDAHVMRAMCYLSVAAPSPRDGDGSLLRVFHSELVIRITRLAMDILGEDASTVNGWTTEYLNELRSKVTAGTLDIQRNIIGERLLGLPK